MTLKHLFSYLLQVLKQSLMTLPLMLYNLTTDITNNDIYTLYLVSQTLQSL